MKRIWYNSILYLYHYNADMLLLLPEKKRSDFSYIGRIIWVSTYITFHLYDLHNLKCRNLRGYKSTEITNKTIVQHCP